MGLFWSMRAANAQDGGAFFPGRLTTVRLTASRDGRLLARARVLRRTELRGVRTRRTSLVTEGFVGRFYQPALDAPAPGILLLGGSGGGLPGGEVPGLLASHGYPTLALAYFGTRGLARDLKEIQLEYFARALEWLGRQPGVDAARLVTYGASRGAEAALLLGSAYPALVRAVVAYAPSSVVNPGLPDGGPAWTLGGRPVPYVDRCQLGDPDPPNCPDAVIRVETTAGPVFLVAGTSDLVWPSAPYADAIRPAAARAQALRRHAARV
jgi:dienelactone hydrolase